MLLTTTATIPVGSLTATVDVQIVDDGDVVGERVPDRWGRHGGRGAHVTH